MAATPVSGAAGALSAELTSPAHGDVRPGETATVVMRVSNTGTAQLSAVATMDVPAGFAYMALPDSFSLDAGAAEVVFYTVSVPADIAPGEYALKLRAAASDGSRVELAAVLRAVAVVSVGISVLEQPTEPVIAGEEFTCRFRVSNFGNVQTTVRLSADVSPSWPVQSEPAEVSLAQGGEAEVAVSVTPPRNLVLSAQANIRLKAYTGEAKADMGGAMAGMGAPGAEGEAAAEEPAAQASASVRVFPAGRTTQDAPMYARLRGRMTTRLSWQEGGQLAVQDLFDLSGDFDNGRTGSVQLTLPRLGGGGGGRFGERSRYTVKYADNKWGEATVGDLSVTLKSGLLSTGLSGRGLDARFNRGAYDVHAFYSDPIGGFGRLAEGVELGVGKGGDSGTTVTVLRQSDKAVPYYGSRPPQESTAMSVLGEVSPEKGVVLVGEVAGFQGEQTGWDSAYRLTADWARSGLTGVAEYVYAGKDFLGQWSDTAAFRLDTAYSPGRKWRIQSNYEDTRRNLSRDPSRSGEDSQRLSASASVELAPTLTARLLHADENRKDPVAGTFDEHSRYTVYELTQRWRSFQLTGSWRDDSRLARTTGLGSVTHELRLLSTTNLGRRATISLDYTDADASGALATQEGRREVRLGGSFQLDRDASASFDIRRSSRSGEASTTSWRGELRSKLARDRELNLRAEGNRGAYGTDTAVAAEYIVPLGLPLKLFPVSGVVKGRVYLTHDPSKGVKGVLVNVDQAKLPPDPRILAPDAGPPGAASTLRPEQREPSGVLGLKPHESALRPADYVSGQPATCDEESGCGSATHRVIPRGQGVVQAEAVTDETGCFSIPGLLPGDYALTLDPTTLPLGVSLGEGGAQRFSITAGQTTSIEVPVQSSGAVAGRATIAVAERPGMEPVVQPFAGAVIELTGPDGVLYRLTDAAGRFAFSELKAGHYQVRLRTETLPEYTEVEPAVIEMDLAPGEVRSDLSFSAKPVQREIEITTESTPGGQP
jgi:hypothetical protein